MTIINVAGDGKKPQYALYKNHKFVKYIGDADKLRIFQRDMQIGQEAAQVLIENPHLNPKAGLGILAAGKKERMGRVPLPDKQYRAIVIDPPDREERSFEETCVI